MTGYQKTKGEDYSETKTRPTKAESVLMNLLSYELRQEVLQLIEEKLRNCGGWNLSVCQAIEELKR